MKRSILLMFCIALLPFAPFAQKSVVVKWGPELKLESKSWISRVLGHDENFFYTLRVPRKGIDKTFWLEKYSIDKMNLIFSKEIELPKVGRAVVDYENLFMYNDQFLLITSYFDSKKDIKYAFAQMISKEGVVNPKFKEIDQVEGKRRKTTSFGIEISMDESKMMVFKNEENTKDANERFAYTMFDENLNQLWTKNIELEHSDKYVEIYNYNIDEKGNVYALTKVYPDLYRGDKRAGRKMQDFKYNIIVYNPQNDETKQFTIDLGPAKFVSGLSYVVTSEGKLAIVGFYSREDASSMDGTFFISLDPESMTKVSQNIKEFDREFLLQFMKERKVNKDEELEDFLFKDILLRDDGGFYIVAEQEYMYVTSYTNSQGGTTYTYHYVANDLIVMNIGSDGEILWTKKINKKQHTTNDGGEYLSYALSWTNSQMHFLFNDDPKNEEKNITDPDKMQVMNRPKKSLALMVSLDNAGNETRGPLFKSKDFKTILEPKLNYAPGGDELIIYGEIGSKYKFGKISFNNFE